MSGRFERILIIADIEGSSGCWNRRASSFMTREWSRACVEMTRDVNAVVQALFNSGVEHIQIKDFHRTGYNLLPELIDPRALTPLSPLYPLNKTANANGQRRALQPTQTGPAPRQRDELPPLLRKCLADYAATGLSLVDLPLGTKLWIGEALTRVTQIGNVSHDLQ